MQPDGKGNHAVGQSSWLKHMALVAVWSLVPVGVAVLAGVISLTGSLLFGGHLDTNKFFRIAPAVLFSVYCISFFFIGIGHSRDLRKGNSLT